MPNAKNSKISTDNLNFLILGKMGSGKSSFASTLPEPIYLFDLDNQNLIYRGRDCDFDTFSHDIKGFIKFDKIFEEVISGKYIADDCKEPRQYKSIVLDGVTALSDLAMERALQLSPKRSETGGAIWNVHYPMVKSIVEGKIRRLLSKEGYKCVIAHLNEIKDEDTGAITVKPLISGDLAIRIPGYFGEVYYARHSIINGEHKFVLQTIAQGLYDARSNLSGIQRLLPDLVPNNFSEILKILNANLKIQENKSSVEHNLYQLNLMKEAKSGK